MRDRRRSSRPGGLWSGPRTIKGKAALILGALLSAIACFLLVYVPRQLSIQAMNLTADKAEAIAEVTAYGLVPGVLFEDDEALASVVSGTRRDTDISYIVVEDSLGHTLRAFALNVAHRQDYRSTDEHTPRPTQDVYRVVESIRHGDRVIGRVYLGVSLDPVRASVEDSRRQLALVIAGVFLLAFIGLLALGSIVTRPISRILGAAEAIAAGDLDRRSEVSSDDEVGAFARTFDSMVARLQSTQTDLQMLNRELEDRVSERTLKLREALAETRAAEREAKESQERFRTIFEASAIGIALIGPDTLLQEVNPAFQKMWQSSRSELTGRPFAELLDPTNTSAVMVALTDVLAGTHEVTDADLPCRPLVSGREVWGHMTTSAVRDPDGSVLFAIAMIEDVTERAELAERLRQSSKLEAVGQLAGGIAHDFNNLLTTINGLSELVLLDLNGAEHLREDIVEIHNAGNRAAALTRQLLAFSRRQALKPKVVDLNVTVREMNTLLRRLIGEDIALDFVLDPRIGRVRADPGQVGQVILNLAVNARDAMPAGGRLHIETSSVHLDGNRAKRYEVPPGSFVQVTVTDTGFGMVPETLRRIFEPFYTTKEQGKGTGLGLATVYGIVKQSGGGIAVESDPGAGTSFLIVLPVVEEVEREADRGLPIPVAGGKETVLVVEDEDSVRNLTVRVLRQKGYEVIGCAAPNEALDLVANNPGRIQAILSDVIMPGMSGPEMATRIRGFAPDIPVLFMSGYPREELSLRGQVEAECSFLQKPIGSEALAAAVRDLLDQRELVVA
jgi:PAS domain S-box-containing protein